MKALELAGPPDPRSGIDENGDWSPAFPGQAPPFQPGNAIARKHGAYVTRPDVADVAAITEHVREQMTADGIYSSSFDLTIESLAVCTWRRNAAVLGLADAQPGERARLEQDMRLWIGTLEKLASALGLTPTSRARLGLDVARTDDALAQLGAAGRAIRERRAAPDG